MCDKMTQKKGQLFRIIPLYSALYLDNRDILKLLLTHGADVSAISSGDMTPLMDALTLTSGAQIEVIELLLAHRAKATINTITDPYGVSPLFYAVNYGRKNLAELLLTHGDQVDAKNAKDHETKPERSRMIHAANYSHTK